jgi:hypothetical protein
MGRTKIYDFIILVDHKFSIMRAGLSAICSKKEKGEVLVQVQD